MITDSDRELIRQVKAKRELFRKGWICLGVWKFMSPRGSVHDLSAADLNQLDRIEREGLFICN